MKYILVPENVVFLNMNDKPVRVPLQDPEGKVVLQLDEHGKPIPGSVVLVPWVQTFREFLQLRVLDAAFTNPRTGMAAVLFTIEGKKVADKATTPGDYIEVPDDVWLALRTSTETPESSPYDMLFGDAQRLGLERCLLPFMEAVTRAVSQLPLQTPESDNK